MLQWLTLTVLWSTTLSAEQEMFGSGKGLRFSIFPESEDDITGIRVRMHPVGTFRNIQVKYGSSWSEVIGAPGGNLQEFNLWPGEHIVGVYGSYKAYFYYLVVFTDIGRQGEFGEDIGHSFVTFPKDPKEVLVGFIGQTQIYGISGFGFKWGKPLVLMPSNCPED